MDEAYRERVRQGEADHEVVPRQVFITIGDLEENGYTVGCPGCKVVLRGTARQFHSAGCRRRMTEVLRDTEKARRAKTRAKEFVKKKEERTRPGGADRGSGPGHGTCR